MFTILGADGKEYGPVAAAKVSEWIAGGRANLQTKARRAGEPEWKTLGDFAEFTSGMNLAPPQGPWAPMQPVTPPAAQGAIRADTGPELAGRWHRLGAVLVDSLIGGIFALPGCAILALAGGFSGRHTGNTVLLFSGVGVLAVAMLALLIIQFYLLTTRGQTMGKKLLGIRIVTFDDESNPGFVKAVLLRIIVNGLIGAVPFGSIYSLVDICLIFRDDRRCIHDLIAGTKVVVAEPVR